MALDLALATRADFEAQRGTRFRLRLDAARCLELELIATEPLPTPPRAARDSFLVSFRAAGRPHLPQQTYRLELEVLGELDVFLVPAGPDARGMRYDAVFS